MKNYKKLIPLGLILLMLLSCYSLVSNTISERNEFNGYMKKGQEAASKNIAIDVDEYYEKALEVKSLPIVYSEWAKYYESIQDYKTAVTLGETALETFPKSPEVYLFLLRNYLNIKDYETFFDAYKKCVSVKATNKDIKELYEKNKYVYTIEMDTYTEAFPFSNGVSRVISVDYSDDGTPYYGYAAAAGTITPQYLNAGDFNSDEISGGISVAPVVDANGNAYFINKEGKKKYDISPKGITVKQLGFYSSGVLSVYDGKEYYLCDIKSKILGGPYEYVTTFNNGIGAIKEGSVWKIINTKGKQIINQTFEDLIIDSKEIMFRGGMFVKSNGVYYLLNEKGEKITDQSFEDARLFVDGLAAVKNNGKWGFINNKGKLVIDYKYHDAKSFSGGFAPVKLNGLWGYITYSEGNGDKLVINYQFDDALGFANSPKVSFVKIDNVWKMLRLYI